jgi:hypothetical protein
MSSTKDVIDHHLKAFGEGDLKDVLSDYALGAVLFTPNGPLRGADAIRPLFDAPCSAGKYFVRQYNILGLLPDPVRGVSDITELYVARYGVPPGGMRVCVRTQQHIKGWEDLPKQTSAIVPEA